MTILVTGATGQLGSKVVEALLQTVPASELAVSVRNPEKAEGLKARGVDVRLGDFDRPETLETAFSGVDRLLIISADGDTETRIRQHAAAVAAAERAQVKFIAYTSVVNAAESSLSLAPVHKATEEAIVKTGIPYSFLRNNWYLENELSSIQGVQAGAPWVTAAGDGKVGYALRQDYAAAAAAVLAGSGHDNTIYELSGELVTQDELAAAVGEVLGKEVAVQHVDDAAYASILTNASLPDFVVQLLGQIQKDIKAGTLAVASDDFKKLLGRPATPLKEALASLINGTN
ncbi:SDR family oxidoreductase [Paenibacillus sp. SYP-B4298]|uniref:SDR family oxidoreductase n=1 Tax=Paenibacillus sp. SYP-B4298 TaxID=2996034 RepID=UPI0022DDE8B6|nr:SDR family oxidoreductase [Paenibacillus sp. SYP-B4298]